MAILSLFLSLSISASLSNPMCSCSKSHFQRHFLDICSVLIFNFSSIIIPGSSSTISCAHSQNIIILIRRKFKLVCFFGYCCVVHWSQESFESDLSGRWQTVNYWHFVGWRWRYVSSDLNTPIHMHAYNWRGFSTSITDSNTIYQCICNKFSSTHCNNYEFKLKLNFIEHLMFVSLFWLAWSWWWLEKLLLFI